jgi:hypothetical protein
MISNCANPDCGAEFLYLHEGELFVIELPDKGVAHYWLCPSCARRMRLVYDRTGAMRLVAKSEVLGEVRLIVREKAA